MALSTKGRRQIEVRGRIFYWDFRAQGRGPGKITPDDMYFAPRPALVRIVAEDKQLHATWDGIRIHVGELARELRPHHVFPVTPRIIRRLIEEALRLQNPERDPRITPSCWWVMI